MTVQSGVSTDDTCKIIFCGSIFSTLHVSMLYDPRGYDTFQSVYISSRATRRVKAWPPLLHISGLQDYASFRRHLGPPPFQEALIGTWLFHFEAVPWHNIRSISFKLDEADPCTMSFLLWHSPLLSRELLPILEALSLSLPSRELIPFLKALIPSLSLRDDSLPWGAHPSSPARSWFPSSRSSFHLCPRWSWTLFSRRSFNLRPRGHWYLSFEALTPSLPFKELIPSSRRWLPLPIEGANSLPPRTSKAWKSWLPSSFLITGISSLHCRRSEILLGSFSLPNTSRR